MTMGSTVEAHHLLEGPEDAPVLVMANSLGTTLELWDAQAPALRDHGESISGSIPDARLTVIPRVSHLTSIEQSEAFTSTMLEYIEPLFVSEKR